MLSLVIGLLTLVLVLNSLLLILMVLVQLPKKEAGLGMAFGAATADALFGAGSGTVLTRWTKYATGSFLALALLLSVLRNHEHRSSGRYIADQLARQAQAAAIPSATTSTGAAPVAPNLVLPGATNLALPPATTNMAPAVTTNVAPAPATSQPPEVPAPVVPNPVDGVVPPAGTPAPQPTP